MRALGVKTVMPENVRSLSSFVTNTSAPAASAAGWCVGSAGVPTAGVASRSATRVGRRFAAHDREDGVGARVCWQLFADVPRREALGRRGAQLDGGHSKALARTGAHLTVRRHVDE